VSPFKPYASRALVIAVAATAVSVLSNDLLALLLANDTIGFIPKHLALSLGSVHSPSYLGLFAGLFLEWAAVAVLGALVFWVLTKRRSQSAT